MAGKYKDGDWQWLPVIVATVAVLAIIVGMSVVLGFLFARW